MDFVKGRGDGAYRKEGPAYASLGPYRFRFGDHVLYLFAFSSIPGLSDNHEVFHYPRDHAIGVLDVEV